jgi:DNA-binding transcriptional MerR regulator
MPWSTSQLAHLGGVRLSTVRFYHAEGLLPEPERAHNGYKHYTGAHLVRLLRIRRLVELGMPLAEVPAALDGDEPMEATLRRLEGELEATIARLELVRTELSHVIEHASPADVPVGFGDIGSGLSPADRAMLLVYSRLLSPEDMASLRALLAMPATRAQREYAALAPDADEATRSRLVEELREEVDRLHRDHPWTVDPGTTASRSRAEVRRILDEARLALYNEAQRDVLRRIGEG